MDNINKKWWEQTSFPHFGYGSDELSSWGKTGLLIYAVKGGPAVTEKSFTGLLDGSMQELQELIVKQGGRLVYRNPVSTDDDSETYHYIFNDSGALSVYLSEDTLNIHWSSNSEELDKKVLEAITPKVLPRISAGRIYTIRATSSGMDLVSMGKASHALEKQNYEQEVITHYDHIIKDFGESDPCGRLVLLNGAPGTGKTYLIKGILSSVPKATFILVPPDLISKFSSPEFIPTLLNIKRRTGDTKTGPTILIIEDADDILVPRASDNMGSITGCLNLSDGIMGQLVDLRILASTNAKRTEIDSALVRPGRLCRRVDVGPLSVETANTVFKRLTGKDRPLMEQNKPWTLAETYARAREDGWVPTKEKQDLGFVIDPYGNMPACFDSPGD